MRFPKGHIFILVLIALGVLLMCTVGCGDKDDGDGGGGDDDDDDNADAADIFDGDAPMVKDPTGITEVTLPNGLKVLAAENQLLISVEIDVDEETLGEILNEIEDAKCVVVGQLPRSRVLQIETQPGDDLVALMSRFDALPGVINAGLNLIGDISARHNNLSGLQAWYRTNVAPVMRPTPCAALNPNPATFTGDEWIDDILARDGWGEETGSTDVTVATVDSGFDLSMDLIVDSRITRIDFNGAAITEEDGDPDGGSHGTYTTTFAAGDGGDGVSDAVGVCWNCSPMSVRALAQVNGDWVIPLANVEAGIETAINNGAAVVNVSIGGLLPADWPGTEANFLLLQQYFREIVTPAVDAARRGDALVTFAAGNEGEGIDGNHLPGSTNYIANTTVYDDDQLLPTGTNESENGWQTNALIVAATTAGEAFNESLTPADKMAAFSRRGDVVNIAAPGENVGVGDNTSHNGTSFSAPIVAGAAGLVKTANPDLIAPEVRQILLDSANGEVLASEDVKVGAGLLDLSRAVEMAKASAEVPVLDTIEATLGQGDTHTASIPFSFEGAVGLDILFMVDTSGSFGDDIDTLQEQATALVAELSVLAENINFGVSSFADFPFDPFGDPSEGDEAFVLDQAITDDLDAVYNAIDQLDQPLNYGMDEPESQLEALYQAATGAGRDLNSDGDYDDLGELAPRDIGWRPDTVKVVILSTDATFHNFSFESDYPGATREETLTALAEAGVIVIGLDSGDTQGQLQDIVDQTSGLFFELSSDSAEIVSAIYDGIYDVTQQMDLTIQIVNDPEGFVTAVVPETHFAVESGDEVTFQVTLTGVLNEPVADLEFMNIRLWIMGNGGILARVPVRIVVPER